MKSILISITSYKPKLELQKIIENYQNNYTAYNLQFVIATPYPLNYTYPNMVVLTTGYTGFAHAWSNKQYLLDNYHNYDYLIETDDDILIPLETFEYYRSQENLPLDYIPGLLSCETKEVDGMIELFLLPSLTFKPICKEFVTLDNKPYYVPNCRHAAAFIVDRARYALALDKGLSTSPGDDPHYHPQEWARTQIYHTLTEVISCTDIERTLVYHLPNKYIWKWPYFFRSLTAHKKDLGQPNIT